MRDSGTSSPCFSAPWMGTAGKGEGKSSYLPASVLDKGSAGFNRNPVMLALLPPLRRRCSSPGVREEQAGVEVQVEEEAGCAPAGVCSPGLCTPSACSKGS